MVRNGAAYEIAHCSNLVAHGERRGLPPVEFSDGPRVPHIDAVVVFFLLGNDGSEDCLLRGDGVIPALDGGHLAFYAAEAVRRKPLGPRSQEWAFRTGMALVLALMIFFTINDVVSLVSFGS